jgi:chromosome segregation ATPase
MSLVAARDSASEEARIRDEQLMEVLGTRNGLEGELTRVRAEGERLAIKIEELKQQVFELEAARNGFKAEAERLNAVVETMTNSRTWRLRGFFLSLMGRSNRR